MTSSHRDLWKQEELRSRNWEQGHRGPPWLGYWWPTKLLRKGKVNDNTVIVVTKQLFAYRVPTFISLNVMVAVSVRAGQSDRANTSDLPYMSVTVTPGFTK